MCVIDFIAYFFMFSYSGKLVDIDFCVLVLWPQRMFICSHSGSLYSAEVVLLHTLCNFVFFDNLSHNTQCVTLNWISHN